jgi:hypothetical protein
MPDQIGTLLPSTESKGYELALAAYKSTFVFIAAEAAINSQKPDVPALKDFVRYRASFTEETAQSTMAPLANILFAPETRDNARHALVSLLNLAAYTATTTQSGSTLNALTVIEAATRLTVEFKHLTLVEIAKALENGAAGQYGAKYNVLNVGTICDWLRQYDLETSDPIREKLRHNEKIVHRDGLSDAMLFASNAQYNREIETEEQKEQREAHEEFKRTLESLKVGKKKSFTGATEAKAPTDAMQCDIEADTAYYYPNGQVNAQGEPLQVFTARLCGEFSPYLTQAQLDHSALLRPKIASPAGWYWELPDNRLAPMSLQNQLLPLQ